jgi:hypothetical protein
MSHIASLLARLCWQFPIENTLLQLSARVTEGERDE